jgi:hypothetical protein
MTKKSSARQNHEITPELVRALFSCDPTTGHLTWLRREVNELFSAKSVAVFNTKYAGKVAGSVNVHGYVVIDLFGLPRLAHRLVWMHITGEAPKHNIDHINGCRSDNRFDNLRDVPQATNNQNRRSANRNNATGLLGVAKVNRRGRTVFVSCITLNEKTIKLGDFTTPEEAHAAYVKAKPAIHASGFVEPAQVA